MAATILKILPAIWIAAVPASAADRSAASYPLHLGNHTLTVRAGALSLDGKRIAQAQRFPVDLQATVDGDPVAAIYADRGGASCYDGDVLLFAAPPGKLAVQGTVEGTSCQARPLVGLANGEVVVVDPPVTAKPEDGTPAVAGSPGAVWLFDAKHGAARAMGIGPEGPDAE